MPYVISEAVPPSDGRIGNDVFNVIHYTDRILVWLGRRTFGRYRIRTSTASDRPLYSEHSADLHGLYICVWSTWTFGLIQQKEARTCSRIYCGCSWKIFLRIPVWNDLFWNIRSRLQYVSTNLLTCI